MRRKRPFQSCQRRWIPRRTQAEIILRQQGRCADCGTRLVVGSLVFDHRPPLGLREERDDPNDPDRIAAICSRCDDVKTPKDLKEIAKTKRLALAHQDFINRTREKVPGRRAVSRRQREQLNRSLGTRLELDED